MFVFQFFFCFQQIANMFENLSSSEWLLYISEWQHQNQSISNIRATTKVAVHSLLSTSEDLQIRGAAIIHNLACKEVKTVVCILPVLNINILTLISRRVLAFIYLITTVISRALRAYFIQDFSARDN